jgi:hypothetical protein
MKTFQEFFKEDVDAPWGGFGGGTPPPSDKIIEPEGLPKGTNTDDGGGEAPPVVKEDGGAVGAAPGAADGQPPVANLTTGVQNYESPFGSSWPTAKKRVEEDEKFVVDSNAKDIIPVTRARGV